MTLINYNLQNLFAQFEVTLSRISQSQYRVRFSTVNKRITFLVEPFTSVDTSKIVSKLIKAMEAISTTDNDSSVWELMKHDLK